MSQVSDVELVQDVLRVAIEIGGRPTKGDYENHGEYQVSTLISRFMTWGNVLWVSCITCTDDKFWLHNDGELGDQPDEGRSYWVDRYGGEGAFPTSEDGWAWEEVEG